MATTGAYLFVHIPKTAGTSLRRAMERAYAGRLLLDYGPRSPETSPVVREAMYRRRELAALGRELARGHVLFLAGHVSYASYGALFPPERVVTLLREPVARVVSEWNHARRHYAYPGDLRTFAGDPANANRQSRTLEGAALERLGFVGLSERYRESLRAMNARFGWSLPYLEENRSPGRLELSGRYDVGDADREVIAAANDADLALYARVKDAWDAATATLR